MFPRLPLSFVLTISLLFVLVLVVVQIPFPPPTSSTSFNTLAPPTLLLEDSLSPILPFRSPSLPTRPSRLARFASIFLESQTSVSMSSTRDSSHQMRGNESVTEISICLGLWKGVAVEWRKNRK